MSSFSQIYFDLINNYQTITAAIIGVLSAIIVSLFQYFTTIFIKEKEKNDFENAVVSAIYEELSCLYNNYSEQFDKAFLNTKDNEYIRTTFTITQDFFIIYHNNSQNIGRIKSAEIRNAIVQIYILLKRLIENILYYNKSYNSLMERRKEYFNGEFKISGKNLYEGLSISDEIFCNVLCTMYGILASDYKTTLENVIDLITKKSKDDRTYEDLNKILLIQNDQVAKKNLVEQTCELKNDYSIIKKRILKVTQMIKEQYTIKASTIIEQNISEVIENKQKKKI